MLKILEKLYPALALGVVLMAGLMFYLHGDMMKDPVKMQTLILTKAIWLHVISGILWIGLLWYFNFVQIPTMPKIPAELKPAIGKFIAPEALFWFRWSALATVLTGATVAYLKGYLVQVLTFDNGPRTITIGMWLALIMAANVWFVIWPNQKKALGMVTVADADKAKAARFAMLASRVNFVLSLPMLYCMVSQGYAG